MQYRMLSKYSRFPFAYTRKSSRVSRADDEFKLQTRITRHIDNCCAEVDSVRQNEWDDILQTFDDRFLMQTWTYGSVRWGENSLSHVVLRKCGKIVAASQAVIIKIPFLPVGLAYVSYGPCWQPSGQPRDLDNFRRMVQVLYQIYAVERGLVLRIFPNEVESGSGELRAILESEGFRKDLYDPPMGTVLLDLSYPLEELRQSLKKRWRHNLVLAERNTLSVTRGVDGDSFRELMVLYEEMKRRKTLETIPDIRYFERIQRDIAAPFKMMCMICRHKGIPVSGAAVSKVGNSAVLIVAATGNRGLTLRSSYFLQWQVLKWLKSSNVRHYNLFGINQETHPGTYQFKSGLGGKLGSEIDYVGAYESANHPITRFSFQAARRGREIVPRLKRKLGNILHMQAGSP